MGTAVYGKNNAIVQIVNNRITNNGPALSIWES